VRVRFTCSIGLLVLAGCAPIIEEPSVAVMAEPIIAEEAVLQRKAICPEGGAVPVDDDGIGGTGCEPVVE